MFKAGDKVKIIKNIYDITDIKFSMDKIYTVYQDPYGPYISINNINDSIGIYVYTMGYSLYYPFNLVPVKADTEHFKLYEELPKTELEYYNWLSGDRY